MKKFISLIIAMLMVASMVAIPASAESTYNAPELIAKEDFTEYTTQSTSSQPRRSLLSAYSYDFDGDSETPDTVTGSGFETNWSSSSSSFVAVIDTNVWYESASTQAAPSAITQNGPTTVYRVLKETSVISVKNDGDYLVSFDVADGPSSSTNKTKSYYFLLGDKIRIGYTNEENSGDYKVKPFIYDGSATTYGAPEYVNNYTSSAGTFPSSFMKVCALISIKDSKVNVKMQMLPTTETPDFNWDISVSNIELTTDISYIGIKLGSNQWSMMSRTKNIEIYKYDSDLIAEAERIAALEKPYEAAYAAKKLPSCAVKNMVNTVVATKGVCIDDFSEYGSNVNAKDVNPVNSGAGWGSAWSQGEHTSFTTSITVSDMKINKSDAGKGLYHYDWSKGFYRKLGFPINFAVNGEYFAKTAIYYHFTTASTSYKKHSMKLYLGDSIVYGSEVNADDNKIYPYVSTDAGVTKKYSTTPINTSQTYEITAHIISSASGEDKIIITFGSLNARTDVPSAKVETTITSDGRAEYFGMTDVSGITLRLNNIQIEGYNTSIGNLNALTVIKENIPAFNSLDSATYRVALDKLNLLETQSYARRYYIDAIPDKVFASEGTLAKDGKKFTAKIVNTGIQNASGNLFIACYEGDILKEVKKAVYTTDEFGVTKDVFAEFTNEPAEGSEIKAYLWNDDYVPYITPIPYS